jgi:predicted aspartyl protease
MVRQGKETMGRVTVDVKLSNVEDRILAARGQLAPDQVREATIRGIVDTGAAMLVLPESVVQLLGFPRNGEATVRYADQRTATRAIVQDVDLEIQGRRNTFNAIVEPGRTDALIGAIVLEALDMLVDCRTQTLHPRDPDRIIAEIE